ncbi:PolyA_pol domain-containing protein/PolyA_pol_RNAbd domain-containing protein [Cephalotus follicularis]|uniref:PolyA_pol domain-containing protein/PolyA_pol_RNAbd domain-containing protein n=1 Tax=Cephalotus follicularis TaxID=3775 RepID=A0A1Q3CSD3_CEPFO|nr:PolyA_pol domain-containing protein/PolyA_pol_RNAbd domain-containing protein [Cephalotus follicularis]
MAMTILRAKRCLLSLLKAPTSVQQRCNHTATETQFHPGMGSNSVACQGGIDMRKWKKWDARLFGIHRGMIPQPPLTTLRILRGEGFDAYLVGGCVRDLLLKKIPKDFDIITTASLTQIRKRFHRAIIVGRRFPICRVKIKDYVVEVSSFETVAKHSAEKEKVLSSETPSGCDAKDFIRWRNSLQRDFTINSLFLDPFLNKIYDYTNGMRDLWSLKLQTLIPANLSFKEDCARIFRGLRIAARLGLSISKDTEIAIRNLSSSVLSLSKGRLMMEVNYMLGYGAAEPSLCLLQRFNLLESFLPSHAAYLHQHTTNKSAQNSIMLMKIFFNLDKLITCDRPSDCSLWVGLLAFHLALLKNPQDALVIQAFASVLYHGKWKDGIKFAREQHAIEKVVFVPEISGFSEVKSDEELTKDVSQLASLVQDSVGSFTDDVALKNQGVFLPKRIGEHVVQIFDVLVNNIESYVHERESFMIDYRLLGMGDLHETRFVIGKIVLETMSSGLVRKGGEFVKEKNNVQEGTEETCCQTLSGLEKHQIVVNNDKKRDLSSPNPEMKKEMAKKQKQVQKNCSLSQEIIIKELDIILEKGSQEEAKKHKEVETCRLPKEEINLFQSNMLDKDLCHIIHEEIIAERRKGDKKYQDRAKKSIKLVENIKVGKLYVDDFDQLAGLVKKMKADKTEKQKQKSIKPKYMPLSSLFRR